MKQTSLKIKNYTASVRVIDYDMRKRLLHFLLIVLGALALSYVFYFNKYGVECSREESFDK